MNFKEFTEFFSFLKEKKLLILLFFTFGIVISFLEGVGLSVVFPLLQQENVESEKLPFFFKLISDFFQGESQNEKMKSIAIFLIASMGLKNLLVYLNSYLSIRFRIFVSKYLQEKCYKHFLDMGLGYVNAQKSGDIQTILSVHTMNIGVSITRISSLIHLPFTILVILFLMFSISYKITLITIIFSFFLMLMFRRINLKADVEGRKIAPAHRALSNYTLQTIQGLKVIKLLNIDEKAIKSFVDHLYDFYESVYKVGKYQALAQPFTQTMGILAVGIILYAASMLFPNLSSSSHEFNQLIVFLLAFMRLVNPIAAVNTARVNLKGDFYYYTEVFNFLKNESKEIIPDGSKIFKGINSKIEFKKVGFCYPTSKVEILKDISFAINKGENLGIVGPSGGGKSTLFEILLRFYDVNRGSIQIDGTNIKEFNIGSLRSQIGVVSQDVFLFHDSIKKNITLGGTEIDEEKLIEAAKKSFSYEFITQFEKGFDTIVGDRGILLSGGQKQRIAIARAIYLDPDILLFDEATSALDTDSEKIVQKALNNLAKNKTVLTIAHRLSTVAHCDNILVIDKGEICEFGKHEELLARNGIFRHLHDSQVI